MNDPLEYTEEQLRDMDSEYLKVLLKESKSKESLYNTQQLVEKTLINGLYGAMANQYFPLFNEDMAAAITGNGRYFIRKLANYIEIELQRLHKRDKPYIVAGDTDSCVGSTLIKTSLGEIPIKKLFNISSGNIELRGDNNFIKHVNENILARSLSEEFCIEDKPIKYIMKHKIKKRMFKIKHNSDEVIITEDHSIIVNRNNKLTSVKPLDILNGDKIIKI